MNTRLALLCTIASASVVMAADLPYVGRWKVHLAKSDFGQTTITFESLPEGEWQATVFGNCAYRKSHLRPEAAGAYRLQIRCSGHASPGAIEKHEKSTLRIGEQRSLVVSGKRELEHLFLGWNCGEDCYVQAARRS